MVQLMSIIVTPRLDQQGGAGISIKPLARYSNDCQIDCSGIHTTLHTIARATFLTSPGLMHVHHRAQSIFLIVESSRSASSSQVVV